MLSKESLEAIGKLLNHFCFLKFVPFDFDPKTFTVKVIEDWRIWLTVGVSAVLFGHCLFLASSLFFGSMSPSDRSVHMVWQLALGFGSLASYNSFKRRHEFVTFINHFFKFNQFLKESYLIIPSEKTQSGYFSQERIIRNIHGFIYFETFVSALVFLFQPKCPRYIYSFVSQPSDSYLIRLPFLCWEFVLYYMCWSLFFFNVILMLSYWYDSSCWIKEMKKKKSTDTTELISEKEKLQNPNRTFVIYRSFQILNQEYNACLASLFMPLFQLFLIVMPTTCNYAVIRLHSQLAAPALVGLPGISLSFVVVVYIVFPFGGALNTLSKSFLSSYKRSPCRRQFKSCWQLKIRLGSLFFLQRYTILKVISLIIYWTMRSMLIF